MPYTEVNINRNRLGGGEGEKAWKICRAAWCSLPAFNSERMLSLLRSSSITIGPDFIFTQQFLQQGGMGAAFWFNEEFSRLKKKKKSSLSRTRVFSSFPPSTEEHSKPPRTTIIEATPQDSPFLLVTDSSSSSTGCFPWAEGIVAQGALIRYWDSLKHLQYSVVAKTGASELWCLNTGLKQRRDDLQVSSVEGSCGLDGAALSSLLEILARTSTSHPEWIQTPWAAQGGASGFGLDSVCVCGHLQSHLKIIKEVFLFNPHWKPVLLLSPN